MTEEQIINRYVRGWTSRSQYRAELVEFYEQEDAKDLVIRQLERFRQPYFDEVDAELDRRWSILADLQQLNSEIKAMNDRWRETYDDWKLASPPEYDVDPRDEKNMELMDEINRMEREISAYRKALDECREYFMDEADAWTEDGQWVSNKQMKLGMMVEEILAKKDFK